MTDHPIIFSAPMIRALLDGRKTQTRRVLGPGNTRFNGGPWTKLHKAQAWAWNHAWVDAGPSPAGNRGPYLHLPWEDGPDPETFEGTSHRIYPAIQPGDRLWVREAWETTLTHDDLKPSEMGGDEPIRYLADGGIQTWGWPVPAPALWGRYRHARFMPRWASRLTLTVTDVRVQRVQEISAGDAVAEGVEPWGVATWKMYGSQGPCWTTMNARDSFRTLWNSLHGPDAWDRNDWVAAYTVTVHRGNIDT